MYRRIGFLWLRDPADTTLDSLLQPGVAGATHSHVGRHLPGTVGGGDYTWDLAFASRDDCPPWPDMLAATGIDDAIDALCERVDVVSFAPSLTVVPEPGIRDFVKRTLFVEVRRGTNDAVIDEFGRVLTGMPRYISAIRNWAYHRVDDELSYGPRRWTHVWEQEFHDLSGLKVDYMVSPYHWGYVDPWFDPESPTRIIEPFVGHVYCAAERSILAWTQPARAQ